MKRYINNYSRSVIAGILLFAAASCKKEYTDPSGPSSDKALSSANALTDVAVGLQNWYTANRTGNIYTKVAASSLLTGETYVVNAGNTDENQLYLGGTNVQNTNTIVTGLWTVSNKIIFDADNVLKNVNSVVSDKNYASGLIAYTSIWKALAIGDMAEFWEQIPDTTGTNVPFITNTAGYARAIAIIDNALATISANAVSTTFIKNIPAGINLQNTLYALKARYALFSGDYATALGAANQVSPGTTSTFNYNSLTTNPIFALVTSTNNIYQVVDSAMSLPPGLRPDAADKRFPFYVAVGTKPVYGIKGFYSALLQNIPVYLPGEMTLIKAECYARQHDIVNGLIELNKVVTKTASQDAFGVGAALPAVVATTESDLLELIYKHRRIELFMGGLALEDERRFNRPATERKRSYFPYPFVERNGNTNTPTDPSF
ncbi:RagB/SusD family nutrient uptake outer membrane protein [Chitinophaga sancti]|uniref:RagB/SusD family nutrient uptake outer membrane protein n=1 Tax=Chitinophaga sancti TaxID=1004 RepID=A0A1K1RCN6_9BACT|nr:RagB/SusD family nutrient uptake outer membrane protein [Chitinophaga sancti]WQD65596.1 RagB/SusD family nutrient uptake outer membrane protein [Chitinophaga sancti]WQG88781.1 RagB/SusD family nutrient uptake outer membrane protein [Chitinophaga sancti]SFW69579.1 SusD family protein [Chitinophaga sancti]